MHVALVNIIMANDDDNVPEEIEQQCVDLHHAIAAVDTVMKPLLTTNRAALGETVQQAMCSRCGHKISVPAGR